MGLVGRLPYVGPGWYGKPRRPSCSTPGSPPGRTSSGPWTPPPTSRRTASPALWTSWSEPGPRARGTWPSSPSTLSSDSGPGPRTSRGGRPGLPVPAGLLRRPGPLPLRPRSTPRSSSPTPPRPAHDFVVALEYVELARIHRALREVPPRYLVALKTDCLQWSIRAFRESACTLWRR